MDLFGNKSDLFVKWSDLFLNNSSLFRKTSRRLCQQVWMFLQNLVMFCQNVVMFYPVAPVICEPGEALARRMRVELMIPALCSFYIDVFQVGIVPFMKIENLFSHPTVSGTGILSVVEGCIFMAIWHSSTSLRAPSTENCRVAREYITVTGCF